MTIPYGAGNDKCWEEYLNLVKEKKLQINLNNNLKKLLIKFHNFIRNKLQTLYLYKKPSENLMREQSKKFEENRIFEIESETGKADLSYYITKKGSIDKKYELEGRKMRITMLKLIPTSALDKAEFDTAIGANTVHFLDADEIRILENNLGYSIITIHDSYLIDYNNCSKLIKARIDHYQKEINNHKEGYVINNIFILL